MKRAVLLYDPLPVNCVMEPSHQWGQHPLEWNWYSLRAKNRLMFQYQQKYWRITSSINEITWFEQSRNAIRANKQPLKAWPDRYTSQWIGLIHFYTVYQQRGLERCIFITILGSWQIFFVMICVWDCSFVAFLKLKRQEDEARFQKNRKAPAVFH